LSPGPVPHLPTFSFKLSGRKYRFLSGVVSVDASTSLCDTVVAIRARKNDRTEKIFFKKKNSKNFFFSFLGKMEWKCLNTRLAAKIRDLCLTAVSTSTSLFLQQLFSLPQILSLSLSLSHSLSPLLDLGLSFFSLF
jgi:hypothetical protein